MRKLLNYKKTKQKKKNFWFWNALKKIQHSIFFFFSILFAIICRSWIEILITFWIAIQIFMPHHRMRITKYTYSLSLSLSFSLIHFVYFWFSFTSMCDFFSSSIFSCLHLIRFAFFFLFCWNERNIYFGKFILKIDIKILPLAMLLHTITSLTIRQKNKTKQNE